MIRTIYGRFPTMNMQTPSLRSSHLDIKDVQCAETKDVLKILYHVISCLGAVGVQIVVFGAQKFNFLQKWPNLQGRLELIRRSFFA